MELKNVNIEENTGSKQDEEKIAATWAADRLNDVYDDDSENEIILSQYNKKDFIS